MPHQKAIILQTPGHAHLTTSRPIPHLRPGYLLVKVTFIALNPTDWKHLDSVAAPGALLGCDYAGTVHATGTNYSKAWAVGDRICGFAHGGDVTQPENGAFAEFIVVKADVQMRIPGWMGDAEAATLGVGAVTVGQGLFTGGWGLEMGRLISIHAGTVRGVGDEEQEGKEPLGTILIYGGSTATGTLGMQVAKL